MKIENCELRASTGRVIAYLTRDEADSMVREGTARKIRTKNGKRHWVLVEPVRPSNSGLDAPCLKPRDTHVVVGLSKPTLEQYERLKGWGFSVPKPKQYRAGKRLLRSA